MSKQTFSSGVMKNSRRRSALKLLTTQLESGFKTVKGSMTQKLALSDKDKARINREINILKLRI